MAGSKSEVYGNTEGLSPASLHAIERIYRRRVGPEEIASPELVRSLAEASVLCGRQLGVLVHRSGVIDYVIVGDSSRLMLPDIGRLRAAQGRFRALRLVHTHLYNELLSADDLVDLVRLRLDMVAAIQIHQGHPRAMHYAYNVPVSDQSVDQSDAQGDAQAGEGSQGASLPYRKVGPVALGQLNVNFGQLMHSLEDEFARASKGRLVRAPDGRAILVQVVTRQSHAGHHEESLRELEELARTAGVAVVDKVVQSRDSLDPRLVIGRGKLDEIVLRCAELDAETLIFDHNLSPSQAAAISKYADVKVIDRTQIILDIFAQHAESADGKLQVELAQLKYRLPRLGLKDDSLSRLTGGIGGRGPGETKLEIGRRRARDRVTFLEGKLKQIAAQREQRRRRRGRRGVPVIAIVGYTNAGKSTLLNALTDSAVIAEDKLFATLDTRSRRLKFPQEREVILTDTVGFIRNLPKDLFAAFRATFEEVSDADVILQVVDAADPARQQHMDTTEEILQELELAEIPRVLVFNKADEMEALEKVCLKASTPLPSVVLSALDPSSFPPLLLKLEEMLEARWRRRDEEDLAAVDRASADAGSGRGSEDQGGETAGGLEAEEMGALAHEGEITTLEQMMGARFRRKGRTPELLPR